MGDTLVNIMQTGSGGEASTAIWGKKELSLTLKDVVASVEITNVATSKTDKNTSYENSIYAVNDTNVGAGGTFTYTLTFTAVFDEGVSSVDLSAITLDIFSLNASGNTQNADRTMAYTYSFEQTGGEVIAKNTTSKDLLLVGGGEWKSDKKDYQALGTKAAYTGDAVSGYVLAPFADGGVTGETISGAQMTINFDEPLELVDNQTYTLKLEIARSQGNTSGFFVGLGNVALKTIPEPTTTTLSLLALAGLALHRRRK